MSMQASSDERSAAREYAWNWFEYHAGQRQAVFRFFLIFSGAIMTGYLSSAGSPIFAEHSYLFGLGLVVTAILFWRLDIRSLYLVKLAEGYLKEDEAHLALLLTTKIQFATMADHGRPSKFPERYITSFRQIYGVIFIIVALIGFAMFLFDQNSPLHCLFGSAT